MRARSESSDSQLTPISTSPEEAGGRRIPAFNRRIKFDVVGVTGEGVRAFFLTSGGVIVTRDVRDSAIDGVPEEWSDLVVSFSSGEQLFRSRNELAPQADGAARLTAAFTAWTVPIRHKTQPIDSLSPEWSAVQRAPRPPRLLAEASDWEEAQLATRLEKNRLTIAVDAAAESIDLQVGQPFALGTAGLSPRASIEVKNATRSNELELWLSLIHI